MIKKIFTIGNGSRRYQNIIHITGTLQSTLVIAGAVLIGKNQYVVGIVLMVVGGILTRILSETEFKKQRALFSENK